MIKVNSNIQHYEYTEFPFLEKKVISMLIQENEEFECKTSYIVTDIEKQLVNFMRIALLAPSSHNTQPWRFKATTTYVEIFADKVA